MPAPPYAPDEVALLRSANRAQLVEAIRASHIDARHFDLEAFDAELRRLLDADASDAGLRDWVQEALRRGLYGFAPAGAVHAEDARYGLPFDAAIPRVLDQGAGGTRSHKGARWYGFDFALPIGTPVFAARDGIVGRVIDGFTRGGLEEPLTGAANAVLVLHIDGSFAEYVHLQPGIPVAEGERVAAGALLGHSDSAAYSSGPQLHFAVHTLDEDYRPRSVPIRFWDGSVTGFVPIAGQHYAIHARPTVELRLYLDGRRIDPGEAVALPQGGAAALRVERVERSGRAVDVTAGPGTTYFSYTPWNVVVDAEGKVEASPAPGFGESDEPYRRQPPAIGVLYRRPGRRELGTGRVQFAPGEPRAPLP